MTKPKSDRLLLMRREYASTESARLTQSRTMTYQREGTRGAIVRGGGVAAHYALAGGRTFLARVHEQGSLRIRQPKGRLCQSVLINTAGGVVAGDEISTKVSLGEGSHVVVTSAAAEKVYRGYEFGTASAVTVQLTLAPTSRLLWLPQETILFDGVKLHRTFTIDLATSAELILAEMLVFGRRAYGEHSISGVLRESWRLRRGGRLVLADETRLDGRIGDMLERRAVASGRSALALLVFAGPRAAEYLEPVRAAFATAIGLDDSNGSEAGASLKDGIIVARILATSAERLRTIITMTLASLSATIPGIWQ